MPTILIATDKQRESKAPPDTPKEEVVHTAPDLSSTPVRETRVQDHEERKDEGTVASKSLGAPAEHISEAVGQGAHGTAQPGASPEQSSSFY